MLLHWTLASPTRRAADKVRRAYHRHAALPRTNDLSTASVLRPWTTTLSTTQATSNGHRWRYLSSSTSSRNTTATRTTKPHAKHKDGGGNGGSNLNNGQPPPSTPSVEKVVVVRRRSPSESSSSSHPNDSNTPAKASPSKVGRFVLRSSNKPPSNTNTTHNKKTVPPKEIKDTAGQSIVVLQPLKRANAKASDSSAQIKDTQPNQSKNNSSAYRLPLLNASALLDTTKYCIQSASSSTSRSGTEAARRLLRGKKDLIQVLRQLLSIDHKGVEHKKGWSTRSIKVQPVTDGPQQFVVQGHGVPPQLLQEHVNYAKAMLQYHECQACLFQSKDPNSLRIRRLNGTQEILPLQPTTDSSSSESTQRLVVTSQDQDALSTMDPNLQLYLTVMKRMASALGSVLRNPSMSKLPLEDDVTSQDDTDLEVGQWRAEFVRGLVLPTKWMPEDALVHPVVEWTPLLIYHEQDDENGQAHVETKGVGGGQVKIRLQGYPTTSTFDNKTDSKEDPPVPLRRRRKRPRDAVSLSFDARF